jgi:hypothetical protein
MIGQATAVGASVSESGHPPPMLLQAYASSTETHVLMDGCDIPLGDPVCKLQLLPEPIL